MKLRLALGVLSVAALAGAGFASSAYTRSSSLVATVFGGGQHGPGCTVGADPGYRVCFPNSRDFSLEAVGLGVGSGRATGTFNYGSRDGGIPDFTVDVHCLRVSGGDAVVGGIVTSSSSNPEAVGLPAVLYVADRGDAGAATSDGVSPIYISYAGAPFPGQPARFPDVCPASASSFMGYLDIAGDVSAHG